MAHSLDFHKVSGVPGEILSSGRMLLNGYQDVKTETTALCFKVTLRNVELN